MKNYDDDDYRNYNNEEYNSYSDSDYESYNNDKYDSYSDRDYGNYDNSGYGNYGQQMPQVTEKQAKIVKGVAGCVVFIFLVPFLFGGLLSLYTGIVPYLKDSYLTKHCTESVVGEVIAVEKNTVTGKRSRDVFYVPVLEYTLNGKTHTQRMQSFFIDTELEEGDKVTIFVDPDKPERFYAPAYHKSEEISLFDILFGLVFIAVSGSIFFSIRSKTNKAFGYDTRDY